MNIMDELGRLLAGISEDVDLEFERLGMYDHEGMRTFGGGYAMTISEDREPTVQDVGSAMVGGILLGLLLAESGVLRVPFPTAGGNRKGGGA